MSNLVKFIDIEKDIERRKSLIQNEIEKSGLTKKQLENGWKLRQMEDLAFDDNEKIMIFHGVCSVLEYDYEKVIDIQRDVEIIDIFEEILDDSGFCIMIDHVERPNEYMYLKLKQQITERIAQYMLIGGTRLTGKLKI